eukprot:TRINITY_DN11488_c0_g1_i1.p1 TRINITY_DN11488_c0_g1~~TRINITY_DN11488_c0_g1_i1.p1  ORF type:complete len:277 (+),score=55.29 TRINITY_DN11488_c0_g1_i1:24-854(+)
MSQHNSPMVSFYSLLSSSILILIQTANAETLTRKDPVFKDVDPLTMLSDDQREIFALGIPIFFTVFGFLLVFFGHKIHRSAFYSFGSILFFGIAFVVVSSEARMDDSFWKTIGISMGVGILGGILFQMTLFFVLFFVGAVPSIILAALLLSTPISNVMVGQISQFLWCFTFAFIGGVTALIFQKYLIILGTSLIGTYLVLGGIDTLAFQGVFDDVIMDSISSLSSTSYSSASTSNFTFPPPYLDAQLFWLEISGGILLFLLGLAIQYKFTSPSSSK